MQHRRRLVASLAAAIAAAAGCDDNQFGVERRLPNRPPDTILTIGPHDSTYASGARVRLYWAGSDVDGAVDHYDFVLVDHPAADDSIATADSAAANRVVVRIPADDDPRWRVTHARDTLIVVRADTLRRDPRPLPGEDDEFVRRQSFERWHTLFLRAVDNEGLADPSPEYRSFNARTVAPSVTLLPPIVANSTFTGPRLIVFNWTGEDPDGPFAGAPPIAARWAMVAVSKRGTAFVGEPESLYALPARRWSPWMAWNRPDGRGVRAVVSGLVPIEGLSRGYYLFAVQAMDESGAVTPVFDAVTPGRNNVARIQVSNELGPTMRVSEPSLGVTTFVGPSNPRSFDVAAGQSIAFRWQGSASEYGAEIDAFRYGWNLRDPNNDEEWNQNWTQGLRRAEPRIFQNGTQRFFVQCRDNVGSVTSAQYELIVRSLTRDRALLIVDDTNRPGAIGDENREDARWLAVVESLRVRRPFAFDPATDVYDVETNPGPPPLRMLFEHEAVLWNVYQGRGDSALRRLGLLFDPFLSTNRNSVKPYNYLELYLDVGGKIWVNGEGPAQNIWPTRGGLYPLPISVTNWNRYDPARTPAFIDSIGTRSLLYRLGVEAFDMGGGGRSGIDRRDRLEQNCRGLLRVEPDSLLGFASTVVFQHRHTLLAQARDVDRPPPGGATWTTTTELDHGHPVPVTHANLVRLQRGESVTLDAASVELPAPHAHAFEVLDRNGVWGVPPRLEVDASWPLPQDAALNPLRTRPNVEIYNMTEVLDEPPALFPPPDLVRVAFTYRSGVPRNSAANVIYPFTADGEAAVLLRRIRPTDRYDARAICGFEVWRLRIDSHVALADYVLLRRMGLGLGR